MSMVYEASSKEFNGASKDARGRFGTLGDEPYLVHPQASRTVPKRSPFLPMWIPRAGEGREEPGLGGHEGCAIKRGFGRASARALYRPKL